MENNHKLLYFIPNYLDFSPLTLRPQICSISYSCPAICFHTF